MLNLALVMIAIGMIGCGRSSGTLGTSGGAGAGGIDSTGSGGGGSSGTGRTVGPCSEPVPCEGYDDRPDANLAAVISCLSPRAAPANVPLALTIYGHHLTPGPNSYAIVTLDTAGTALNGVSVSACHIDVQVPADVIAVPREASVVVSPGGWIQSSGSTPLTIR